MRRLRHSIATRVGLVGYLEGHLDLFVLSVFDWRHRLTPSRAVRSMLRSYTRYPTPVADGAMADAGVLQ